MPNSDDTAETLEYICQKCGYRNIWTDDEVRQRGRKEIYRSSEDEVIYSLRCKNSGPPRCDARRTIALSVKQ